MVANTTIINPCTLQSSLAMTAQNIYQVALNSLSAHIAILDKNGLIIETNRAWRDFARKNGLHGNPSSIGINYLEICRKGSRSPNDKPAVIAQAIRKIISGGIQEFLINYPCHSPEKQRWFSLRIVRFKDPHSRQVILTHENITPFIQIQRSLVKKESLLTQQAQKVEESNTALKVLLKHREDERKQLENRVLSNIRELILPYVDRLQDKKLSAREQALVEIIKQRLNEVISPFLSNLRSLHVTLTPQEIHVATLIREGKTSKEIAAAMTISVSGVDFHRKQIRKKLKLTGTATNLRSYLLSLRQ